jgi:glycosyltransferase involved in cell wall biosynthesis
MTDEASPGDVLHVTWSGRIGGIERQIEAIVTYAAEHGPRKHRACFLDGRGPIGDALVARGLADRLGLRRGLDLPGLWRLARLLRRVRPRFIHLQTHSLASHVVAQLALPEATRVYTEHSPRALRHDRKFVLLYRLLRRTCSVFIALAPAMVAALERYGVGRDRIRLVPNPVAVPLRDSYPTRSADTPVIGAVARLEEQKRVDLLLEVLAELRRRGVDCSGLVVGEGSKRVQLEAQRAALGLENLVEFAGEQIDVTPWLDRLDVFLITSAVEPFGIAAVEAMARGVPVVGMPAKGGLEELVARGGVLLADRDVATAADAIVQLLSSNEAYDEARSRGRALAAEHSLERNVLALEAVYRDLERG